MQFLDALVNALVDIAFVAPIMYLAFLLVGYFSHNGSQKYSKFLHHSKKAGPLVGAFLGCVPQCGFSSVMSQLYSHKVVTLGTLFAVFIATSDEAVLLMVTEPVHIPRLLLMIGIKLVFALVVGYGIDITYNIFVKIKNNKKVKAQKLALERAGEKGADIGEVESAEIIKKDINIVSASEVVNGNFQLVRQEKKTEEHHHHDEEEGGEIEICDCGHIHSKEDCCARNIFLDALKHTAIIIAYVFAATLVINVLINYCGLDTIKNLFTDNIYIQILIACLVGLVPNCAFSTTLVVLYTSGTIMFAPLVAGLCAAGGVGFIVLFTANRKHTFQNLLIVLALFVLAYGCGLITSLIV